MASSAKPALSVAITGPDDEVPTASLDKEAIISIYKDTIESLTKVIAQLEKSDLKSVQAVLSAEDMASIMTLLDLSFANIINS